MMMHYAGIVPCHRILAVIGQLGIEPFVQRSDEARLVRAIDDFAAIGQVAKAKNARSLACRHRRGHGSAHDAPCMKQSRLNRSWLATGTPGRLPFLTQICRQSAP